MLGVRLPKDVEDRLGALARRTGRTKSFYARRAILSQLDEMERVALAEEEAARRAGGAAVAPVRPSQALAAHREAVRRVVAAHRAGNVRVFGSAARGEDHGGSDLDLLVDPTPETTLFDLGAMRRELASLLGVPVDVHTPGSLPESFRAQALAEAVPV